MDDTTEKALETAERSRFGLLELGARTWLVVERERPKSFEKHGSGPWRGTCFYRVVFRGKRRDAVARYQAERTGEGTW